MSNRFLSRGQSKNKNDEDDLVSRQMSALSGSETAENPPTFESTENPVVSEEPEAPKPVQNYEKRSVLQQGLTITGSINSETALFIYGTVNGNVTCESDVTIEGTIAGNLKAKGVQLLAGCVKGDIDSKSDITILRGAAVRGNIKGESVNCDGEISGNTVVSGRAVIKEHGVVTGDIACERIAINEGAIFKGNIQTNSEKAAEASESTAIELDDRMIDLKKYI